MHFPGTLRTNKTQRAGGPWGARTEARGGEAALASGATASAAAVGPGAIHKRSRGGEGRGINWGRDTEKYHTQLQLERTRQSPNILDQSSNKFNKAPTETY